MVRQFGFDLFAFVLAHSLQLTQRPAFADQERNARERTRRKCNQPQDHRGGHSRLSFYSIELSESND